MPYISRYRLNVTVTASGGAAQSFLTPALQTGGYLESITMTNGSVSGISTAANLKVTNSYSSAILLNVTSTGTTAETVSYYPRAKVTDNVGGILSWASGAGAVVGVPDRFAVGAGEAIKVTFSSAGTASAGGRRATLDLYVSGN